jgi:hypothetical protein
MPEPWLPVWAALTDEGLEKRLRYYLWLEKITPAVPQPRISLLSAEAERRGRPEIVTRAAQWVARSKTAPLLS